MIRLARLVVLLISALVLAATAVAHATLELPAEPAGAQEREQR